MKRYLVGIAAAGLVAAGLLGAAQAGRRQTAAVSVTSTAASGSLGSARRSSDSTQYIGCDASGSIGSRTMVCRAKNASGVTKTCVARTTDQRDLVHDLKGDSFLSFTVRSDGTCDSITVSNYSDWIPK